MQNKNAETDSESEQGAFEDEESDFENHDNFEKDAYHPIRTPPEDELNFHTDGELTTGEIKEKIILTENQANNRIHTGEHVHGNFGY